MSVHYSLSAAILLIIASVVAAFVPDDVNTGDVNIPLITPRPESLEKRLVIQEGFNGDLVGWYWKDGCEYS
jgi:hypothetical protein